MPHIPLATFPYSIITVMTVITRSNGPPLLAQGWLTVLQVQDHKGTSLFYPLTAGNRGSAASRVEEHTARLPPVLSASVSFPRHSIRASARASSEACLPRDFLPATIMAVVFLAFRAAALQLLASYQRLPVLPQEVQTELSLLSAPASHTSSWDLMPVQCPWATRSTPRRSVLVPTPALQLRVPRSPGSLCPSHGACIRVPGGGRR